LAGEQEGLGKLAYAANLERAKVLIPMAFGRFRLGFARKFQLIKVFGFDFAFAQTI
jgi:hypothetical protein